MAAENPTIKNLKKRLKPCLKGLKEVLESNDLFFERQPISRHRHELFYLGSQNSTTASAKYQYAVLPLLPSPTSFFWVGATVKFIFFPPDWKMNELSIIVFEGSATDAEKTPILRAEWDSYYQIEQNQHAQPHWHIYTPDTSKSNFDNLVLSDKVEENVEVFGQSVSDEEIMFAHENSQKMHFAMAAQWHNDHKDRAQIDLSDEYMTKWLPSCIKYISEQLAYAYSL